MSNMFGGVVFIAVIIVILLQFTAKSNIDADSEADVTTKTQSIADLDALRQRVAMLNEMVDSTKGHGDQSDDPNQQVFTSLLAELATTTHILEQLQEKDRNLSILSDTAEQASQELMQQQHEIESQQLEVQIKLTEALARPPERLRIPSFSQTIKTEVPVLLSRGKLVNVFDLSASGASRTLNAKDLLIDKQQQTVEARAGRGLQVQDTRIGREAVLKEFKNLNASTHYISIAVWPDSFASAAVVRDALLDLGFEYGLVFVTQSKGVPFRATGGVQ